MLQFFGTKHAVFRANFAEMYPFMNKIAKMDLKWKCSLFFFLPPGHNSFCGHSVAELSE